MSVPTRQTPAADRILEGYPLEMRKSIFLQREELKARQQSGDLTVGPWAPAARLTKPIARKKAKAVVATFRKRA